MDLSLFIPETLLSALAALLCVLMVLRPVCDRTLSRLMLAAGFVLLAATLRTLPASGTLFGGTYTVDALSQGFKTILAVAFLFVTVFAGQSEAIPQGRRTEYQFFVTTSLLGMMMIASAADLLTLYVALELSSYSLYLLASLKADKRSAEAGVKYLLFGAAASGLLLWGFSLIAGLTGTTSLPAIAAQAAAHAAEPAFLLGVLLASIAFLFKLSAFPAHFWAPDVYESAATPVTAYIATASKAAAAAVLVRVFIWTGFTAPTVAIVGALAFVSMTLGNCVALVQRDVKRLLAYSSIAQAGYILVGLLSGSPEGYSSVLFYSLAYVLMNTGAFLAVIWIAKTGGTDNPTVDDFDGLAERSPFLALILLLSLLSLAGIPPLVGFTGKWILFSAAMQEGHWFLVLWGVLNSVVSLFYYLTIVKHAYLEKPKTSSALALPVSLTALGLILFAALVALGVYPTQLITFAQNAVASALVST